MWLLTPTACGYLLQAVAKFLSLCLRRIGKIKGLRPRVEGIALRFKRQMEKHSFARPMGQPFEFSGVRGKG